MRRHLLVESEKKIKMLKTAFVATKRSTNVRMITLIINNAGKFLASRNQNSTLNFKGGSFTQNMQK